MDTQKVRAEIIANGLVQGVGFRWFVHREAVRLGLTGWVTNNADGSVSLVAQGERSTLEDLVASVRRGPRSSMVRNVTLEWSTEEISFKTFDIR